VGGKGTEKRRREKDLVPTRSCFKEGPKIPESTSPRKKFLDDIQKHYLVEKLKKRDAEV